jgi:O-acetylhomoserine (thiol)-lyase
VGMKRGMNTLAVHAGNQPEAVTGSVLPPIFQTAAFEFRDTKHAADLFNLDEMGFVYSRLTNPTVSALEEKLAVLEGGVGATVVSSGIAAHLTALFPLMKAGDHFIASNKLYGGTVNQLSTSFQHFGWDCSLVEPDDAANFQRALTPKTKAIFVESVSNPMGVVVDIEAVAKVARGAGIPLIVDNTVPTPVLCRPFEWGADIVTHSTTKYLCGNGTTIGGVVIDSGKFNWVQNDKFPSLAKSEPSYGGRNFQQAFGEMAYTAYGHAVCLRDLGVTQAPMNAFITFLGIETVGLRMKQHSANAQGVAEFLSGHKKIAAVSHAGLKTSPYHALAQKYLPNGSSSLFTFTVKDGYDACVAFIEKLKMFSHCANIGDTRTLVIHPASTTHHQLTEEQMRSVGLAPGTIRISVGIEDAADIVAELDQALG